MGGGGLSSPEVYLILPEMCVGGFKAISYKAVSHEFSLPIPQQVHQNNVLLLKVAGSSGDRRNLNRCWLYIPC
jgi:hypothetical protein